MKKIIFSFFISLISFAYSINCFCVNYSSDANCMGYWPMECAGGSNETDLSGEGADLVETSGTIDRSAVVYKFGTYSRQLQISETEYFTHADGLSTDISGANQSLSVCAFIYRGALSGDRGIIGKYNNTGAAYQYLFKTNVTTNKFQFSVFSAASSGSVTSDTAIGTSSVWYHVAGVYNDTDVRVYLDGSLDCTPVAYSDGIKDIATPFTVGAFYWNSLITGYIDSYLDDVAIFDRELTSVEISDINTNGIVGSVEPAAGQVITIFF